MGLREETVFNEDEREFKRIVECMEDAILDAQDAIRRHTPLTGKDVLDLSLKILTCDVALLKLRQKMEK